MKLVVSFMLYCCFASIGCKNPKKVPGGVLSKDKMGTILFDIAMSEAHMEELHMKDSTVKREAGMRAGMDTILAIHKVSQKEFQDSYAFYREHPVVYKIMLDTLHARIQRNREVLYRDLPGPAEGRLKLKQDQQKKSKDE